MKLSSKSTLNTKRADPARLREEYHRIRASAIGDDHNGTAP
jgi:hypothetical protein